MKDKAALSLRFDWIKMKYNKRFLSIFMLIIVGLNSSTSFVSGLKIPKFLPTIPSIPKIVPTLPKWFPTLPNLITNKSAIIDLLPTPKGFFELSKNLIAAYPLKFAVDAINKVCSTAVTTNMIKSNYTPDINQMNFQFYTVCKQYKYSLLKAEDMLLNTEFDPHKKLVILATGWTTTIEKSEAIDVFEQAFRCRKDVNFVAVDAASYVDTLYSWSALNTEEIGYHIARGLVKLTKTIPVENIHLIGHSLGAHIVGSAGRNFEDMTNKTIPRITGLDPAKPCFHEGESLSGLQPGDAKFIDVIHSNPGVLGKRDHTGDVDFYPGGLDPLPPGCFSIVCAHGRAWWYFAETIYPGNENNFMATRCTSLTRLRQGKCKGRQFPMGYGTPNNLKGNYFLEVNSEEPFGKNGIPKQNPFIKRCGQCKSKK